MTDQTEAADAKPAGSPSDNEIGILERRKIEAGIIAPIYAVMCEHFGEDQAKAVLKLAIRRAAIASGKHFAARSPGGTNMQSFRELQPLWTKDDALTIEVIAATDDQFDFNVHRCRYAETYREMGLSSIGHLLSCNRDGAFCGGYDPRLKLTRTQTIMAGADHCNFRYRLEEDKEAPALEQR
ncbi:L-2-amino-thiazoline-4-carboxylic acid hydrolase [Bradyrhizobium sp. Pear77]|uniref:L-2-amino-thiazoline-4-carboxylic acid hydrolase n=1 Tax=Bradyrhizobium TaxID=374 RepID=UPI001E4554F9|nr:MULTISPECIES: L-2-amino-thiazoline-4-carboxylic acid hydrolase [Bradyrhizobium]MCC8953595.1 L-2-amino-thiazoline-4-carboxylic acid hydrolase [Bradyrhizobium altum]MCC8962894.1 L-2-amino-thiazoline-4-carboxylic acid hydrolase [Bradyrhizobium oropedii]